MSKANYMTHEQIEERIRRMDDRKEATRKLLAIIRARLAVQDDYLRLTLNLMVDEIERCGNE